MTLAAWRRLAEPRPELCLFGIEPELANEPGIRYVTAPSDDEVNELFNKPRCSCRPPSTRASACRPWSRWPPAARSSALTPTATVTSARR